MLATISSSGSSRLIHSTASKRRRYFFSFASQITSPRTMGTPVFRATRAGPVVVQAGTAEEIHEDAFIEQHVLVGKHAHRVSLGKGPQDAPRKVAFFDRLSATLAAIAIDEPIDQGIVHFAHDEMAGISVHPMGKGAQLPVAEVRREEKHAPALALGARVVFKPIVNNQPFNVVAVPMGEMGVVGQHAPEILEETINDPAPLPLRPFRKRQPQIEQPHSPQAGPKPVAQCRQQGANTRAPACGEASRAF